jgi:multiple sugar transport system permease protein
MPARGSERLATPAGPLVRTGRSSNWLDREDVLGYLLVAPVVIIVLGLVGYPFGLAILLSLTDKTIGAPAHFVGFSNFIRLARDPIYRQSVRNTLIFTAGSEALKVPIGFLLALILNEAIPFRRTIRSAVLLPWIVPTVLSAMAWTWMFNPNFSVLNWILLHLGLVSSGLPWLTDPNLAMFSVVLVNAWRGSPFFAIILLAALQAIPADLYEATAVDGAGRWERFRHVTLPLVLPILLIAVLLSTIATFSDFNIVYTITDGGPLNSTHVLATYSFATAITVGRLGEGAAIALTMFPVLLLFLVWEIRYLSRQAAG